MDGRKIKEVGAGIWTLEDKIKRLGLVLPIKMVVMRYQGDRLLIHSPVYMTEDSAAEVRKLGTVERVVAPNCFHHLFAGRFMEFFPEAEFFAAEGVEKKSRALKDVKPLAHLNESLFGGDVKVHFIDGMPRVNETAFYHRPSSTLVLADLIFNIHEPMNRLSRFALKLYGLYEEPRCSRLFKFCIQNKVLFSDSLGQILENDFTKIIVAHGKTLEFSSAMNAQEEFRKIMNPFLKDV